MILSICDEPTIMEVFRIIVLFINIIKILVPIILIIVVSIKITGAITKGNQEDVMKTVKSCIPNMIAAVLIFLVPTFVNLVAGIAFPNSDYTKCIAGISKEKINGIAESKMDTLITEAEEIQTYVSYSKAASYLSNVKDEAKKEQYQERLDALSKLLDEKYKEKSSTPTSSALVSTGLGRDIVATDELITACKWVVNQELVNIRLYTCSDSHRYKNANAELPGGATERTNDDKAKETIPLSEYQKGVFFGEEKIEIPPESRYAFMIIYRTVFIHNTVHYAMRSNRDPLTGEEITYRAGSCAQNYRNSQRQRKYDSGKYKLEIDDAQDVTKYLILTNTDGKTTDARYHSYTGIEQAIERAGREGKKFTEILENVIKSGNNDSAYYKNARVYDCRNLLETGQINYVVK